MDFSNALKMMKNGHELTRTSWNMPRLTVRLDAGLLVKRFVNPDIEVPVTFDSEDILAMDWELIR